MGEKALFNGSKKSGLIKLLRARCANDRVSLGYLKRIERDPDLDSCKQHRKAFERSRKTVDAYKPKLMLTDVGSLTQSCSKNYGKKKVNRNSGAGLYN
eukprot:Awhi_evm1s15434